MAGSEKSLCKGLKSNYTTPYEETGVKKLDEFTIKFIIEELNLQKKFQTLNQRFSLIPLTIAFATCGLFII